MGLFSKKDPCAICGGKVSGLFPWKIEGQYVCNTCHGVIDMQDDSNLTMAQFCAYRDFREKNQALKSQFGVTQTIDFGLWDTKIVFDHTHGLFCMSKNLDKTIFHGSELKSFVIREDNAPLFEGGPEGLTRYTSAVPEKLAAMEPRITQFRMQQQMQNTLERLSDKKDGTRVRRYVDIPEPFESFNVELHFDHPYWSVITCDMTGPTFDNDYPDIGDYMRSYQNEVEGMDTLAVALMRVAFPDTKGSGAAAPNRAQQQPVDTAAELKKFKALMDEGVITQEEFDAKKKQLLGI